MMGVQFYLGATAGLLALAAFPVYIWGIFRSGVRPNKATWWILTLASIILAASYYSEGARNTVWLAVAYALGCLIIAILSLRHGDSGWTALDKICLIAAIASALAWWIFNEPLIAFWVTLLIDFIGMVPTIYKSYKRPITESSYAWIVDLVASLLALASIEKWTFIIVVYPLYLTLTHAILVYLIFVRDRAHKPRL